MAILAIEVKNVADPVDPADRSDQQREEPGGTTMPSRRLRSGLARFWAPSSSHNPSGSSTSAADHGETERRPREHLDTQDRARDHPRERSRDQQPRERASQPLLAREPQKPSRRRGDVEQQIRRRHRRAGDKQHAELNRQQQHRARDTRRSRHHSKQEGEQRAHRPQPMHPGSLAALVATSSRLAGETARPEAKGLDLPVESRNASRT